MRHNEKSENIAQGRRSLVIASQAVGVVAVYRRHRRPNPFVSGQSFHFQMTVALGEILLGPLTSDFKFCQNVCKFAKMLLNFDAFFSDFRRVQKPDAHAVAP